MTRWKNWVSLILVILASVGSIPITVENGEGRDLATGSTPRIGLLHMHDGAWFFQRLGNLTLSNKRRYAKRWKYHMISVTPQGSSGIYDQRGTPISNFDIDHSRAPTFGKIKLALAACEGRKDFWLLWSDADAMVVNQSVPLESIIDDHYDLIFAYDWLMLNAGMLLVKCTPWSIGFFSKVYNDRKFDKARALDQSALQKYLDDLKKSNVREFSEHVKILPKYAMNVYLEEYRPGDFLLHMAGKLYESTENGLWAIARQFDVLSMVDDVNDIKAFFNTRYLLNYYSGTCDRRNGANDCKPDDGRRLKLNETLASMSTPKRYRHVALRYYFFPNGWTDPYDITGWKVKRKQLPEPVDFRGPSEADVLKRELREIETESGNRAPRIPVHETVVKQQHNHRVVRDEMNDRPQGLKHPPEVDLDAPDDGDSPLDKAEKLSANIGNGAEDEPVSIDSVKKALAQDDKEDSESDEEVSDSGGFSVVRRVAAIMIGVVVVAAVGLLYRRRKHAIKVQ